MFFFLLFIFVVFSFVILMNLQFTNLDVDSIHCMLKSICYIGSLLYIEINSLLKQLYIHVRKYSESHVFTLSYQICVPKTYWLTSLKYDNISGIYVWSIFQFNRQTGILINCFLIIIKNKHLHSSLRFYFGGGSYNGTWRKQYSILGIDLYL